MKPSTNAGTRPIKYLKQRNWLLIGVVLAFIIGIRSITTQPIQPSAFYAGAPERPLVIAHRGGAAERPENTLLAFEHAAALGVDVIELDIRSTADGVLVALHDATLERTTNGNGPVLAIDYVALRELDAAYHWQAEEADGYPYRGLGVRVPSLAEILQRFPEQRFSIELKQHEPLLAKPTCALVVEQNAQERVLVASFDSDTVIAFRRACPEVATGAYEWEVVSFTTYFKLGLASLYHPRAHVLHVPPERYGISLSTADYFAAARRRGMRTEVWTVNERAKMEQLVNRQVDGFMTDFPERAMAVLAAQQRDTLAP